MKLTDLALGVGVSLILIPPIFDLQIDRWIYYALVLVGCVLCAIGGYNSQAKMIGLGEPGEELLQKGWRWFKHRVLRRPLEAKTSVDPTRLPYHSVVPNPERSALSRGMFIAGVVLAAIPIVFGAAMENKVAYTFVGVGCVLMMIARHNVPPADLSDPPHGRELFQVWWEWLKGSGKK